MDYLEVDCPCCRSRLIIDSKLGRVLSHKKYKEKIDSFSEFLDKEKGKEKVLDQAFEIGKKKEKGKMEFLEKKIALVRKQKNIDLSDLNSKKRMLWD